MGSISENQVKSIRVIVEHARAVTFLLAEGIVPLNIEQGYVLRRMIRKVLRHGKMLGIEDEFLSILAPKIIDTYPREYPHLELKLDKIIM